MIVISKLSWSRRSQARVIAAVSSPVIALLGYSFRWVVEGFNHYKAIRSVGNQPIFVFWHGRILPATYFWRRRGIVVMTSENFDGECIAQIIKRFGYETSRGSTSHAGRRALAKLRRDMHAGKPAAFTVDGPQGPARSVKPGAVWLAHLTGKPILPFHIEANRYWSTRSWDHTQIPKPFTHVAVVIGEPLWVPNQTEEIGLEHFRKRLETQLCALATRASTLVHR